MSDWAKKSKYDWVINTLAVCLLWLMACLLTGCSGAGFAPRNLSEVALTTLAVVDADEDIESIPEIPNTLGPSQAVPTPIETEQPDPPSAETDPGAFTGDPEESLPAPVENPAESALLDAPVPDDAALSAEGAGVPPALPFINMNSPVDWACPPCEKVKLWWKGLSPEEKEKFGFELRFKQDANWQEYPAFHWNHGERTYYVTGWHGPQYLVEQWEKTKDPAYQLPASGDTSGEACSGGNCYRKGKKWR